MSINAYTGTTGSGKSAHAARDIRNALRAGRPVICNFELKPNAPVTPEQRALFTYLPNDKITSATVIDLVKGYWESGAHEFRQDWILLVIDEAQVRFNSRRWNDRGRDQFLFWLTQSRHYGVKVILITQSTNMIDNQFRYLIDEEHNHRKLYQMPVFGILFWLLFRGRASLDVVKLYAANEKIRAEWYVYGRKDFAMYDSYATISEDLLVLTEFKAESRMRGK